MSKILLVEDNPNAAKRIKQHGGVLPWAAMPLTAGNDRKKAAALISQNRHQ